MKSLARECIKRVKPYTPGKPIEEVERELGLKTVIKLASNENCFGPSPKALRAIIGNARGVNRYPDADSFYLKKALASRLDIGAENLIIGNGSDEIITLAARAFLNEGDEVVTARPTFLIYEIASQIANAKIVLVPMKAFRYDLKGMKAAITPMTKMVFIANPDNPAGTYVTKSELSDFFEGLPEGVITFLDEAYFEFAKDIKDYPNGLDFFKKLKVNLIITRTFSKAYGLAGLRVGYGIAGPEVISALERVREPFNVNILAQRAALAALGDNAFLKKTLDHAKREKSFLYTVFQKMGLKYIKSAANFVLVDVAADSRALFERMLKSGVIVRDMKAWGLDTFIRVTIGTREENKKFIEVLKKELA